MSEVTASEVELPQATEENVAPAEVAEGTAPAEEQPVAPKTYTEDEVKALKDAEAAKIRNKYERKLERQRIEAETREQVKAEARPQPPGKPTSDQYSSYDDYIEALADWKAETKFNEIRERESREEQDRREKANQTRRNERQQDLLEAGENKYPDFEEVVKADKSEYSQAAYLAILESDISHDIVYHLAKNQDEAKRIANLPAYAQAKEIGKLEDRLSAKKPVKAPNAPDPIKPIGSGASPSVDLKNASMDDYMKMRLKDKPVWAR